MYEQVKNAQGINEKEQHLELFTKYDEAHYELSFYNFYPISNTF